MPRAEPVGVAEPGDRLQHALDLAYGHLGRRERTVAEVRRHLERKGIETAAADAAIRTLAEQGHLDDAGFAGRFAEDRRRLDGWGAERIERRLLDRGVDRDVAAAALAGLDGPTELEAALAILARRFPEPPSDDRGRARAFGVLIRKGYDAELAHDALRAHARRAPR